MPNVRSMKLPEFVPRGAQAPRIRLTRAIACVVYVLLSASVLVAAPGASTLTLVCGAVPSEGDAPLRVRFTCKPNIAATNWHWTFGDGQTSATANPVHIYERIGNFDVRVRVRAEKQVSEWRQRVHASLNKTVTVAAGGGGAELSFVARHNQKIRIHMQALDGGMEPYGFLESRSGAEYRPANDTVRDGENTWEGAVPDNGRYKLTVFDGSNRGGRVKVTIEEPQG